MLACTKAKKLGFQRGGEYNLAIFAVNLHDTPRFAFVNVFKEILNSIKFFLNINISHDNFVKILYLIVSLFHTYKFTYFTSSGKRQKPKSKAFSYHEKKGGAVPTLTHHEALILSED